MLLDKPKHADTSNNSFVMANFKMFIFFNLKGGSQRQREERHRQTDCKTQLFHQG